MSHHYHARRSEAVVTRDTVTSLGTFLTNEGARLVVAADVAEWGAKPVALDWRDLLARRGFVEAHAQDGTYLTWLVWPCTCSTGEQTARVNRQARGIED